jgi:hypothetical protein
MKMDSGQRKRRWVSTYPSPSQFNPQAFFYLDVPSDGYTPPDISVAFPWLPQHLTFAFMMLTLKAKAGQFVVSTTVLSPITAGLLK